MNQPESIDRPLFQLKGGMVTATVLEILSNNLPLLRRHMGEKLAQMPHLFRGSPLVLGLDKLRSEDGPIDLAGIVAFCRDQGLHPFAVRASRTDDIVAAQALNLTLLPATMRTRDLPETAAPVQTAPSAPAAQGPAAEATPAAVAPVESGAARPGKVITTPVRSGQQIYAEGGDLIILSSVSAGAEIIADGHIHCYGMLRGRAIAGARGDTSARLFCQQLGAELVSIAGHYKTAEQLRQMPDWGKGVSISLSNEALSIVTLN